MIFNIKTLLKSIALVPVATVMFAGSAQAQLLGDTVNGQLGSTGGPSFLNQNAEVTDPGVEFTAVGNQNASISLDVKDNSFDIIYNLSTLDFIGFPSTWTLSDFDSAITDVTLVSGDSSLINGISFTDDSVKVDLADITKATGQVQTWSFNVATANAAQSVPEPTTILGLFAVGGAAVVSRRKKQAAK
ncbi:MAG: PEP-CTERM sorting domain-containing protein [Rivularia sp. ALOHA_DT_140]|nr:PEP-CTERM sorting domain-containing protein [Rivularia sp. ALOHA_DT_140]